MSGGTTETSVSATLVSFISLCFKCVLFTLIRNFAIVFFKGAGQKIYIIIILLKVCIFL